MSDKVLIGNMRPWAQENKMDKPKAVADRDHASLNEAAYKQLRSMILTLKLKPEESVSEAKLTARMNVGRAAIRYAIQKLASEHLVSVVPRGKTAVNALVISEVQQAYQVRTALEVLSARLAAQRSRPVNLKAMRSALDRTNEALSKNDLVLAHNFLHDFHLEMNNTALNWILQSQLYIVMNITERFEYYRAAELHLHNGNPVHLEALLGAISEHDADKAEAIVKGPIGSGRSLMVGELLGVSLTVR